MTESSSIVIYICKRDWAGVEMKKVQERNTFIPACLRTHRHARTCALMDERARTRRLKENNRPELQWGFLCPKRGGMLAEQLLLIACTYSICLFTQRKGES